MIQQIITKGSYNFQGSLEDFKHCISSFKVTKVICEGEIQGIKIFEGFGKFRYHNEFHNIKISKLWTDSNVLVINYLGGYK